MWTKVGKEMTIGDCHPLGWVKKNNFGVRQGRADPVRGEGGEVVTGVVGLSLIHI